MSERNTTLPQYSTSQHNRSDQLPQYYDHPEFRDAELADIWAQYVSPQMALPTCPVPTDLTLTSRDSLSLQNSSSQTSSSRMASTTSSNSMDSSRTTSISTDGSHVNPPPPQYTARSPLLSSGERQSNLTSMQKARAKLFPSLRGSQPLIDEEEALAIKQAKAEQKLREKRELERFRREEMLKFCVLAAGGPLSSR